MSFAFARARRDACQLARREAEEPGQRITVPAVYVEPQAAEPEPQRVHAHGETCDCNLRGE